MNRGRWGHALHLFERLVVRTGREHQGQGNTDSPDPPPAPLGGWGDRVQGGVIASLH